MSKNFYTIEDCKTFELPKINDVRGNLTFIEDNRHIPFNFKRVFYIYDVPEGQKRAGHALKTKEFLIAVFGSFDVLVDDGFYRKKVSLNRSYSGLFLPELIWRELENFSQGSICLVLASDFYTENDHIRDYDEFKEKIRKLRKHCNG